MIRLPIKFEQEVLEQYGIEPCFDNEGSFLAYMASENGVYMRRKCVDREIAAIALEAMRKIFQGAKSKTEPFDFVGWAIYKFWYDKDNMNELIFKAVEEIYGNENSS